MELKDFDLSAAFQGMCHNEPEHLRGRSSACSRAPEPRAPANDEQPPPLRLVGTSPIRVRRWPGARDLRRSRSSTCASACSIYVDGAGPAATCAPAIRLLRVRTDTVARADSAAVLRLRRRAGRVQTTLTRPDLFADYYLEQFRLLVKNHGVALGGQRRAAHPVHFACLSTTTKATSAPSAAACCATTSTCRLGAMDDGIANGTFEPRLGEPQPLALFTAPRVDYSLHRLRHYTGTRPEFFQNFVLFTNYQFYIDEFIRLGHEAMADPGREYIALSSRATSHRRAGLPRRGRRRRAAAAAPAADAGLPPGASDRSGITMVNIGVGPANAKTITDHIAVLRPHAWIMLGHCAGLRNSQQLGDYVLAHGYVREDHVLDEELPPWVPIPAARRGAGGARGAVAEVTQLWLRAQAPHAHRHRGQHRQPQLGALPAAQRHAEQPERRFSQSRAVALTWKRPPSPPTASASACPTAPCCASATSRCTARSSCPAWPTTSTASADQHLRIGIPRARAVARRASIACTAASCAARRGGVPVAPAASSFPPEHPVRHVRRRVATPDPPPPPTARAGGGSACSPHPADDAAQHALPVHRLPHRLCARAASPCPPGDLALRWCCACSARRAWTTSARAPIGACRGARRTLVQAFVEQFERYRATVGPWPSPSCRAATHHRAPHRQPRLSARGAALRRAGRLRRPTPRAATRWPGPSARSARRPRTPPGHALPQRPRRRAARRHRPALRVRPLRRVAGDEPAHLRPAGQALAAPPTLVDATLRAHPRGAGRHRAAGGAAVHVPFPGAMYGAFRIAQAIKAARSRSRHRARRRLRQYRAARTGRAARVRPFRLRHARRRRAPAAGAARAPAGPARQRSRLVRTFVREDGQVRYINRCRARRPLRRGRHAHLGRPAAGRLPVAARHAQPDAPAVVDGRWNKLTVAHGCYWKKCSFCDVSLTTSAATTAPPPAAGRPHRGHRRRNRPDRLSLRRRGRAAQGAQGAGRRAAARGVAIRGGATSASKSPSPRAVPGCSPTAAASPSRAAWKWPRPPAAADEGACRWSRWWRASPTRFTDAGILVHAYLMYGFPPTVQDTVDALEYDAPALRRRLHPVRLLPPFRLHRAFAGGRNPEYGVTSEPLPRSASPRTTSASSTPPGWTTTPGQGAQQGALQLHARHRFRRGTPRTLSVSIVMTPFPRIDAVAAPTPWSAGCADLQIRRPSPPDLAVQRPPRAVAVGNRAMRGCVDADPGSRWTDWLLRLSIVPAKGGRPASKTARPDRIARHRRKPAAGELNRAIPRKRSRPTTSPSRVTQRNRAGKDGWLEYLLPETRERDTQRPAPCGAAPITTTSARSSSFIPATLMRRHPLQPRSTGVRYLAGRSLAPLGRDGISPRPARHRDLARRPSCSAGRLRRASRVRVRNGAMVEPSSPWIRSTRHRNIGFDGTVRILPTTSGRDDNCRATGDIEVGGVVEPATLEASGSIVWSGRRARRAGWQDRR